MVHDSAFQNKKIYGYYSKLSLNNQMTEFYYALLVFKQMRIIRIYCSLGILAFVAIFEWRPLTAKLVLVLPLLLRKIY